MQLAKLFTKREILHFETPLPIRFKFLVLPHPPSPNIQHPVRSLKYGLHLERLDKRFNYQLHSFYEINNELHKHRSIEKIFERLDKHLLLIPNKQLKAHH
jgi:hypothetical protein